MSDRYWGILAMVCIAVLIFALVVFAHTASQLICFEGAAPTSFCLVSIRKIGELR